MSNDRSSLKILIRDICSAVLLAANLLLAPCSIAHELAIDEIELHLNHKGDWLLGAVSFDPELARKLGTEPDPGAGRAAVAFVQDNLVVRINGAVKSCGIEVRELYVPGGAVPGDILDLKCPIAEPGPVSVSLELGKAWGPVALGVAGESDTGEGQGAPIIRRGGEHSPTFRMYSTAPPSSSAVLPKPAGTAPETRALDRTPVNRLLRFAWLGFSHVVPSGMDHLLFVVGLVLGTAHSLCGLLWQLSIFTLAHTVTLGLAAAGIPLLPSVIVEPLIALSISWIAVANLIRLRTVGVESKSTRSRLWIIALFGLVHGQGFASVLFGIGFSRQDFWAPLISINFGVELGHILVAAGAWGTLRLVQRPLKSTRRFRLGASGVIGLFGLVWTVERIGAGMGWL